MLVGQPPFLAQTAADTQIRVVQWYNYLKLPGEPRLKKDASNLIRQLLRDPSDRLSDPVKIKSHPFFESVAWDKLVQQTPPYVPTVSNRLKFHSFVKLSGIGSSSDHTSISSTRIIISINKNSNIITGRSNISCCSINISSTISIYYCNNCISRSRIHNRSVSRNHSCSNISTSSSRNTDSDSSTCSGNIISSSSCCGNGSVVYATFVDRYK